MTFYIETESRGDVNKRVRMPYPMEHAGYLAQVANVDSSVVQTVSQGHTVHRGRATNIHVLTDHAFTRIILPFQHTNLTR